MKLIFQDLGIIRYAEMQSNNLIIICGSNNSGKTYVTYAYYGFMDFWRHIYEIPIDGDVIQKLKKTGVHTIDLCEYSDITNAQKIINDACIEYTKRLPVVFAATQNKFNNARFEIQIDDGEVKLSKDVHSGRVGPSNTKIDVLQFLKAENESEITFTLLTENFPDDIPNFVITQFISNAIKNIVFGSIFPHVFIASAERTGAAIFRDELNFARNKLLDVLSDKNKDITPFDLIERTISDYALPVDDNVDFIRSLEAVSRTDSFLTTQHKDVLTRFVDILGGNYQIEKSGDLRFVTSKKSIKLSMDESSSSVRSLLLLGFYLKHVAQRNDLLIIDEPELNLHPENQRKMARLLASLVNCGLSILITTHSDYILREFSNLIMLNGNSPHLMQIIKEEGYDNEELLSASKINAYIAKEDNQCLPGKKRSSDIQTLVKVDIDTEKGICTSSFDTTIDAMNRIMDAIIFGG